MLHLRKADPHTIPVSLFCPEGCVAIKTFNRGPYNALFFFFFLGWWGSQIVSRQNRTVQSSCNSTPTDFVEEVIVKCDRCGEWIMDQIGSMPMICLLSDRLQAHPRGLVNWCGNALNFILPPTLVVAHYTESEKRKKQEKSKGFYLSSPKRFNYTVKSRKNKPTLAPVSD